MEKQGTLILIGVLSLFLLIGCGRKVETPASEAPVVEIPVTETPAEEPVEEVELLISAAASMTDVLAELTETYKEVAPNVTLTYTFGGSGALQTQIEEGAPADIFISAAQKQMDALEESGHIVNESRKTLLTNKVVLVSPLDNELNITSIEELVRDDVKKIGLGDPASVPVGQYSEEIFTNLNILDKITPKAVYASDVRTVLAWVEAGEVDFGLVYATDAASTDKVKVITEAPEASHKEVSYPVAIISSSKHKDESQAFLDYLSSEEAAEIFIKHGFTMK
ncbi:molybdate ABC transporter substrate-binding protein [Tissierella creatinini]|nr:molybdate ABC transporter substrate-binding protein [Tissierella creatinini]TJX66141.1 molybdate ABC transporter substrate-binding protein [Soehngenia saccharolytica]